METTGIHVGIMRMAGGARARVEAVVDGASVIRQSVSTSVVVEDENDDDDDDDGGGGDDEHRRDARPC